MFNKVINTANTPDADASEVNTFNITEDGEHADTPVPDAHEESEEDTSPKIDSVSAVYNGKHTDITVRVWAPTGWQNKRIILMGRVTANKLSAAFENVANW
jgi:hypothetical protein